jgi:hypothetical protein
MCAKRKSCGKSASLLLGLARLPNIALVTSEGKHIEKNWGHVVISYINLFYTLFEPASMLYDHSSMQELFEINVAILKTYSTVSRDV